MRAHASWSETRPTPDLLTPGAVLVLVVANGFFVAAEVAPVAVRRPRVDGSMRAGRFGAA